MKHIGILTRRQLLSAHFSIVGSQWLIPLLSMRSPVTSSLVLRSLTGEVCSRELSKWAGMSESPLQQRLPTLDADSSFNPIASQSTLPVSTLCQPVIAWKGSQKALHRLSAHHRRICRLASGWCAWSASTKTLGLSEGNLLRPSDFHTSLKITHSLRNKLRDHSSASPGQK